MWMRKGLVVAASAANERSTTSFKVSLGPQEVMELRRVTFSLYSSDPSPTVAFHRTMAALSSADLEVETNLSIAAAIGTPRAVFARPDLFLFSQASMRVLDATGVVKGFYETVYLDPPIVLPRTPSLVFYNQNSADAQVVDCVIYYTKRIANRDEIIKLMKQYKSIKPASVPRVIDE